MHNVVRRRQFNLRTLCTLSVLLVPLLVSSLGRLAIAVHFHSAGVGNGHRNVICPTLTRFSPISASLPPNTIVGYITDDPSFRYPRFLNDELMSERLAAMPVVIAPSTRPDVLVGDFHSTEGASKIIQEQGLSIIRDFGGGLMLLRRGGS